DRVAPLVLDGEQQTDVRIDLDGHPISDGRIALDEKSLTIDAPPDAGESTIHSRIAPATNISLEGLYVSSGVFCTQCEPEGFRRITYFPDRPDVLSRYTVTLRADRECCPVLLSNGDRIASGALAGGRHFATWRDPSPKPTYLFAVVAGDLAALEDAFVTMSGRRVALRIYSTPHNLPRCTHAMESLKRAMRWDEERFGREYDLDTFMIFCAASSSPRMLDRWRIRCVPTNIRRSTISIRQRFTRRAPRSFECSIRCLGRSVSGAAWTSTSRVTTAAPSRATTSSRRCRTRRTSISCSFAAGTRRRARPW